VHELARDGERIDSREIRDGDEITIGRTRFRYFIGDGALDRARR